MNNIIVITFFVCNAPFVIANSVSVAARFDIGLSDEIKQNIQDNLSILSYKAEAIAYLIKQIILTLALVRDPWIYKTMRNNICFCCKTTKKKKKEPKNLFKYF